jgi:hypothetical protein
MTDIYAIGAHELRTIPPDIVHCILREILVEAEARELNARVATYATDVGGGLFAIYDLSLFSRISAGVRNILIEGTAPSPYAGIALIGASFTTRTFVDMLARAAKVVARNPMAFPHKFVKSPEEAFLWFDQLRAERRTQGDGP